MPIAPAKCAVTLLVVTIASHAAIAASTPSMSPRVSSPAMRVSMPGWRASKRARSSPASPYCRSTRRASAASATAASASSGADLRAASHARSLFLEAAPRDAHVPARAERCAHRCRSHGIGIEQHARLPREARRIAPEERRQRAQRDLRVAPLERARILRRRRDADSRHASRENRRQARIDVDHRFAAAAHELGQQRAEEHLVAQSLLAAHRHAARVREVCGSEARQSRVRDRGLRRPRRETRLVAFPSLREPMLAQRDLPDPVARVGRAGAKRERVRVERAGLAEVAEVEGRSGLGERGFDERGIRLRRAGVEPRRAVEVAAIAQRMAPVEQRAGETGAPFERLGVARGRRFARALRGEREPEVVQHIRIARPQLQRALEDRARARGIAGFQQRAAEGRVGAGMAGVEGGGLAQGDDRLLAAPEAREQRAEMEARGRGGRIALQRAPQVRHRFLEPPGVRQHEGAIREKGGVARIALERIADQRESLVDAAAPREHAAQEVQRGRVGGPPREDRAPRHLRLGEAPRLEQRVRLPFRRRGAHRCAPSPFPTYRGCGP